MNKFSDKKRKHIRHCEAFSAEAIRKKITLDCFVPRNDGYLFK